MIDWIRIPRSLPANGRVDSRGCRGGGRSPDQTISRYIHAMGHWFPSLGLQLFLDCSFQKSWPAQLVVKASGSFSPGTSEDPRLATFACGNKISLIVMVREAMAADNSSICPLHLLEPTSHSLLEKDRTVCNTWPFLQPLY